MKKEIQTGVKTFNGIITNNYYYVDKTDLIREFVKKPLMVNLFTRPRRFGKSLTMSMLDCFLNMNYKGNTWFDGLKISKCRECDRHKNAYPVISVSFKDAYNENKDVMLVNMGNLMAALYSRYTYLAESNKPGDYYKLYFKMAELKQLTEGDYHVSLLNLITMLHLHHGVKPVLLIDEYDSPITESYGKENGEWVLNLMRKILSSALKDDDDIQYAAVTGVMQITKESIFSGLNNLEVYNIFDDDFSEGFGFTNDEVKEICEYYADSNGQDASRLFEEAKKWYDGYVFGDKEIYNPWGILKYASRKFKAEAYWANTSGNLIINTLLDNPDDSIDDILIRLSEGNEVSRSISSSVTMEELGDPASIFSVMVMSGYLKARFDGGECLLSIPNKEVREEFGRMMMKRAVSNPDHVTSLVKAMVSGDADAMTMSLRGILMDSIGYLALEDERSYNLIISCLLIERDSGFSVKSEFEAGNRRYDIALTSRRPDTPNIIMELKKIDSDTPHDKAMESAGNALRQIHEKRYYHCMKGDTILYGISFTGKNPHIVMERMNL